VIVEDPFSAALTGITWTCTASGGASCGNASGAGDISEEVNLPLDGVVTFVAHATVRSNAAEDLSNTATVVPPPGVSDLDAANDSATDLDTAGRPVADLSITKTDGVESYVPGGTLTYTIVVSNAGPSDVAGVTVNDAVLALPQVNGATWTCAAVGGATCTAGPVTGDLSERSRSRSKDGDLHPPRDPEAERLGRSRQLRERGAPSGADDPAPGNNTATDSDTEGAPVADLSLAKTVDNTAPGLGGQVVFSVRVTNRGPSVATGVVVKDLLPEGMRSSLARVPETTTRSRASGA